MFALRRTLSVAKYMFKFNHKIATQLTVTCSKSTIETLEKVGKYVQS